MTAPVLVLTLPAAPDAQASMTALRMRQRVSRLHPHITTAAAFAAPDGRFAAPKVRPEWEELVLVPLDLTHLLAATGQVDRLAERMSADHPRLRVTVARPIGPAPALLNLVDSRLRLAAHRAHCQEMDALVLSAPDPGDQRGAAMLSRMSRLWSQHHHLPAHLATNTNGAGDIAEVVGGLRREGRRHIAVGSLWVCQDSSANDHARRALAAGAEVVASAVGDDPTLAAWAFERYCSAALGMVSEPDDEPRADRGTGDDDPKVVADEDGTAPGA
ncbi:sirohydrochlorin chelatase [Acidipropionibacterium timonense]|uniref:sirohydrochlorin chelatase n=1 Tax=Acidipropionibacterium timonense TaxID=2161818 RepID=UPI001FD8D578|nr:CbiX/SirB N-terminal domain-containing protein [Acidipropionibacterium timonense]